MRLSPRSGKWRNRWVSVGIRLEDDAIRLPAVQEPPNDPKQHVAAEYRTERAFPWPSSPTNRLSPISVTPQASFVNRDVTHADQKTYLAVVVRTATARGSCSREARHGRSQRRRKDLQKAAWAIDRRIARGGTIGCQVHCCQWSVSNAHTPPLPGSRPRPVGIGRTMSLTFDHSGLGRDFRFA